jgi:hypothetical protein
VRTRKLPMVVVPAANSSIAEMPGQELDRDRKLDRTHLTGERCAQLGSRPRRAEDSDLTGAGVGRHGQGDQQRNGRG